MARQYEGRRPEESALHRIVGQHLKSMAYRLRGPSRRRRVRRTHKSAAIAKNEAGSPVLPQPQPVFPMSVSLGLEANPPPLEVPTALLVGALEAPEPLLAAFDEPEASDELEAGTDVPLPVEPEPWSELVRLLVPEVAVEVEADALVAEVGPPLEVDATELVDAEDVAEVAVDVEADAVVAEVGPPLEVETPGLVDAEDVADVAWLEELPELDDEAVTQTPAEHVPPGQTAPLLEATSGLQVPWLPQEAGSWQGPGTGHAERSVAEHWAHAPVAWHAGFWELGQLAPPSAPKSCWHATHDSAPEHTGVVPLQLPLARQPTHWFVAVSQCSDGGQSVSETQSTHWPASGPVSTQALPPSTGLQGSVAEQAPQSSVAWLQTGVEPLH